MGSRNPLVGNILLFVVCLICLTGMNAGRAVQSQRAKPPETSDPDMFVLTVSVTDKQDNAVSALKRDQFHVFENGIEQKLSYFWEDTRPLTVGFVFDDSYRMRADNKNDVLADAGSSFLGAGNPADEYFIVRTADSADVVQSFSTDPSKVLKVHGSTGSLALYDSIFLGMQFLEEAANDRKVLLVITAGGDTCGYSTPPCCEDWRKISDQKLIGFALKHSMQIYSVMVDEHLDRDQVAADYKNAPDLPCAPIPEDPDPTVRIINRIEEYVNRDANLLEQLAAITGGRMHTTPNSVRGVEYLSAAISRGLRTQYFVGYKSANAVRDGKRRSLKVKVDAAPESGKLNVWTSSGIYAARESK